MVPTSRRFQRRGNSRNAGADHGHAPDARRRLIGEFALPRSARIDQATDDLAGEVMIETGLIAGDADIDEIRWPRLTLFTKSASARNGRAIETRSAEPSEITRAASSGRLIRLLAVTGIETAFFRSARRFDEGRMRNRARDGGHGRLVPANTC